MSFECPQCESKVFDNICSVCEYSTFIIPNNIEQRKNNSDYLSLIHCLAKKINVKEEVIENLISFKDFSIYLSIITDIVVDKDYSINQFSISIPEIITNTKYKQHPFFIFSNFSLYNTQFSVKHIELDKDEIVAVFNNNFSQNKQYISLILQAFKKPKLCISLQYKLEDTIPHDTSLLNKKERRNLKNNIEEQIEQYNIVSWSEHDEKNNSFFEKEVTIDWTQEINIILQNIQSEIDIFQEEVDSTIEELKEINKSFFERALLEKEIERF